MDTQDVFAKIVCAFLDNPHDWLTVHDLAKKTGLAAEILEPALREHPERFKREMIIGVPSYTWMQPTSTPMGTPRYAIPLYDDASPELGDLNAKIFSAFKTPDSWRTAQGIADEANLPLSVVHNYLSQNDHLFLVESISGIPIYGLTDQGKILYDHKAKSRADIGTNLASRV